MDSKLGQQWEAEGYIVLRNLFDEARTAQLRAICDTVLDQWRVEQSPNWQTWRRTRCNGHAPSQPPCLLCRRYGWVKGIDGCGCGSAGVGCRTRNSGR